LCYTASIDPPAAAGASAVVNALTQTFESDVGATKESSTSGPTCKHPLMGSHAQGGKPVCMQNFPGEHGRMV
jgi:hypothetical protein